MRNSRLSSALLFAVVMFAAGCSTTESPRRQVNDLEITAQVKSKLAQDVAPSSVVDVHVNTTNGIVTLAGQVESQQIKEHAQQVAMQVPGVVSVNNNLQVAVGPEAAHGNS